MSENNLFELWFGNAGQLKQKMNGAKINISSIRDYFLFEILKQRVPNFSPDEIVRNEHGKPGLKNSHLTFNLSHCGENFALVLCDQQYCGIDIQTVRSRANYDDALRSVLTDHEYAQLNGIGNENSFFQLWSLKEAYIKAMGSSIWYGRDYDFSEILPNYSNRWIYSNNLYIYSTEIDKGICLSVAVPHKPDEIDFRKI